MVIDGGEDCPVRPECPEEVGDWEAVRRQLAFVRHRYQEQCRQAGDLAARLDEIRRNHDALAAEREQLYQDHLVLQAILRSRAWRVLNRLASLKRRLAGLTHRLGRGVRRPAPAAPPAPAAAPPAVDAPGPAVCQLDRVGGPRMPSGRKFRVVFVVRPGVHDGASIRYRGYNVIEALHLSGIEAAHVDEEHLPALLGRVLAYDLIVLVRRPLTDTIAGLLDAADWAGVPVVFDIDDYVFAGHVIPHVEWFRQQPPEVGREYVRARLASLTRCRYFTGSTPLLVGHAAELGKASYLIRNGLNTAQLALSERVLGRARPAADGSVRLGYFSGTRTHGADFRLIAPTLARLLDEFAHVRLVVAGHFDMAEFPEFGRFGDRVETPPFVDWRDLPALIGRVDVNLIPLEVNPFTEAKSDLKYYEAGLLRVPSVASPTRVLARGIRHGVNGLLARTPEEWDEALRSLVVDAGLRQRLGRNAREHVLREYVPEVVAREAVAAYRDIIRRHRRRQFGAGDDARTFTILLSNLEQLVIDRAPVLRLAEELARLGAGVTLWLEPGGRVGTAVRADQVLGAHGFEPLCAIQVGGDIACGDVLLATDARTAHVAKAHAHRAVQVAYLIPEYEPAYLADDAERRRACTSYHLGLRQLTLDGGLADRISRRHGGTVAVLPAWAEPCAGPARDWAAAGKLLVYVPWTLPLCLWAPAAEALARFHRLHPGVEILLSGVTALRGMGIAAPHRQLGTPTGAELEALVADAPVCLLLHTTTAPRWAYDLMAAGCAVVAAGGDTEVAPPAFAPRRGFLSVAPETDGLVQTLDAVFVDPVLRTALAQHAVAHTRKMPRAAETARTLLQVVSGPALAETAVRSAG